jgi:hypothetical protein
MRRNPAKSTSVESQNTERRLVPLEQAPLRKEAVGSARAAMREISRLNKTLEEFDRTIEPAYSRWERDNIGDLLTRESELKARINRLTDLMEFATMEALFTGKNPYNIFTKAEQQQRETAEAPPPDSGPTEEERKREEETRRRDAAFSEEERDFRSHLRNIFGYDPEEMTKRDYKRMFGDYKKWRARFEAATAAATRAKAAAIPERLKELYRHLVRRLHPDTGKAPDPFLESLWHDLQEAYKNRDLERMELLLAITDVNTGGDAVQSTLFHIRLVSRKLGDTLAGLKKRIGGIRKSEAWKFWHAKDRKQAETALRKAANARVEKEEMNLAQLEAEVAWWKSQARPQRATQPSKPKHQQATGSTLQKKSTHKKQPPPSATQTSFDF